jgi:3-deoxy-7-phosphoheptulonate synthase
MTSDPSHGTGLRDKVPPMARASLAAGADALLIEVHHNPDKAFSDGAQSLYPEQFSQLMNELRMIAPAVGRKIA